MVECANQKVHKQPGTHMFYFTLRLFHLVLYFFTKTGSFKRKFGFFRLILKFG